MYITCREFEIKTRHVAISLEKPAQLVAHRQTQVYITCREFEIKTRHVAISLEKPKHKAEEILKLVSYLILEPHRILLLNFVKMCH